MGGSGRLMFQVVKQDDGGREMEKKNSGPPPNFLGFNWGHSVLQVIDELTFFPPVWRLKKLLKPMSELIDTSFRPTKPIVI